MGFISFLILGLIGGAIAKLIIPGKQGGWFSTLLLGVIGALLAGWLGSAITGENVYDANGFWSIWSWLYAIAGALLVTVIWQLIVNRRARKS